MNQGPSVHRKFFELIDDVCLIDLALEDTRPEEMIGHDCRSVNCGKSTYHYIANAEIDEDKWLRTRLLVDKKSGMFIEDLAIDPENPTN